jgi:type VI secretion system protein
MAREWSLLERLDRAEEKGGRSLHVNREQVVDSVLNHLRKMLNVRQGSSPALPLYGMPDFNDLAARFPEAIAEIQRAIKVSIERYEPRLKKVRIKHLSDDEDRLQLRFEITAQLVAGEDNPAIWFETSLNTVGRVTIRG